MRGTQEELFETWYWLTVMQMQPGETPVNIFGPEYLAAYEEWVVTLSPGFSFYFAEKLTRSSNAEEPIKDAAGSAGIEKLFLD